MSDVVNSNKKYNDDWGVKGYQIPKFNYLLDKPPNNKFAKSKITNFLAEQQRSKSFVPGPDYNIAGTMKGSSYSFLKRDRPLFTKDQIKATSFIPPPGTYNTDLKNTITGGSKV